MKLPEPSCPFGFTYHDLLKILDDGQISILNRWYPHNTCTGSAVKADRKSKLQRYATVCADNPHGAIWSQQDILEFLKDHEDESS